MHSPENYRHCTRDDVAAAWPSDYRPDAFAPIPEPVRQGCAQASPFGLQSLRAPDLRASS
ncbi:hypothetical protein C8Q70DRAFT_985221 [Cubamyces menziesii]|nr:hypothetical protein C8Q70DRAFT_985221 [Cubamyces menziesii]